MVAPKKHRMRVIALAATKGGVGKTTLASALAVRAAADKLRVALIDTDPQKSLARWHELRGFPANPKVVEIDAAREALALLISQRWDWVFIDTPPAFLDKIENAVSVADFVLIPSKPSAVDVEAVRDVVAICREQDKPFAFVLNQILPPPGRITDEAQRYLEVDGPVLGARIQTRKAFVAAMTLGKSGPEMKDGKASGEEIDALWSELQLLVSKTHER